MYGVIAWYPAVAQKLGTTNLYQDLTVYKRPQLRPPQTTFELKRKTEEKN